MNREQRRKAEKDEAKQRLDMWPSGFCEVPTELAPTLKDGDKFTIAGLRRKKDGTFTRTCKPGNETVFIAKTLKTRPVRPAVLGRK